MFVEPNDVMIASLKEYSERECCIRGAGQTGLNLLNISLLIALRAGDIM